MFYIESLNTVTEKMLVSLTVARSGWWGFVVAFQA